MTAKKTTKKTEVESTNGKVLRLFGDIAFVSIMFTCAISVLLFALTIAQKITITVGK